MLDRLVKALRSLLVTSTSYNPGIKILLVCTANQCRSPMAEGLLRAHLARAGVHAQVGSAGLMRGGHPATSDAIGVMGDRGVDIGRHVSCQLAPEIAQSANLVVGMTRQHVREACVTYGALLQRSFTLRELVRRGEAVGPRRPDETLYTWLARVGAGRRPEDLVGDSAEDDIADPVGRPRIHYEETVEILDDLLGRLVNLVVGSAVGAERTTGTGASHHRL